MLYRPHFLYRLKLICIYLIVKLEFLHPLVPKAFKDELPRGWNDRMFWLAFKSGGTKLYFEYYCKLKKADSYEPKVVVDAKYKLTEEEISSFHENGYLGPFEVISPEDIEGIKEHLVKLAETKSKIFSYARGDYKFESDRNGSVRSFDDLSENEKYYVDVLNTFERHLEDSTLLNLYKHPAIIERCAQVLGPNLLIWHSNHFGVNPHSKGSTWHQASRWLSFDMKEPVLYPENEEEVFELTCWIALTDASEEKSCLKLIPDSGKEIYPMKLKIKEDDEGRVYGKYDVELDYPINPDLVKILPAKAGQFYLFCERTVHGSTDNTTDEKRWAAGCRIIKANTKVFTKNMLENGLDLAVYGVKKIKLEKWKPVLVRGKEQS